MAEALYWILILIAIYLATKFLLWCIDGFVAWDKHKKWDKEEN